MKKQDELKAQLTTMKASAEALINGGDLLKAKEEMDKMDKIRDQISALDKLDADFAEKAEAKNTAKPAGKEDSVAVFARAARNGFRGSMSEGTKADGGYIVPEDIETQIYKYKEAKFSLRDLVTSIGVNTMSGSRTFKTKGASAGLTKVSEGGKIAAGATPQFEVLKYEVEKYADVFPVTNELLDDTDANLTGAITEWIADAEVNGENAAILEQLKTAEATTITSLDDIKKAINVTLGAAYAGSVSIVTNDDGLQYLDTLKDADDHYLLTPDPREPMQMRLSVGARSVPIVVVPSSVLASESDSIPFFIGDMQEAVIFWDRKLLTISVSNTASVGDLNAYEQDLTLYRAIARFDVTVKDKGAYVYGKLAKN